MADVRPLRALHYNLEAISSLADVTAPPYDVIDAGERAALVARSPFNVVEIDLPVAAEGGDPYEHAGETLEEWTLAGILSQDREPAIWALAQDFAGPDGERRTRRGILARVRVTDYGPGLIRPHERTHPGPREDRLRLTRATRHNLSPIFSLATADPVAHLESAMASDPWGEVTDPDGTGHRVWRIPDPAVHEALAADLDGAELLIADGHHRYETARTYAEEVGGDGEHRYTLMCLVGLDDPGLTVFGYHRLLSNLGEPDAQERLAATLRERFEIEEVSVERLDPAGEEGVGVFGYIDAHLKRGFRLRLRDTALVDEALPGRSEAYRRLDAAILEAVVLRDALGMSEDDIEAKHGISYASSTDAALAALDSGAHAAFLMRPTPVAQVRAVAAAGETMPPKSTYFFPKLLTGLVFNPLS